MMPSPSHVASRYLEGGVFEAPPNLLKSYLQWAIPVYAGHVLVRAQRMVAQMRDRERPWLDALSDVERTLRSYKADISRLQPGEAVVWDVWWRQAGLPIPYKVGVKRMEGVEDNLYLFNTSEKRLTFTGRKVLYTRRTLPYTEDRVGSVLLTIKEKLTERLEMARVHSSGNDDIMLVEASLLVREAAKYASSPKAYKVQAVTSLPITLDSLRGWKYWDRILEANNGNEGQVAQILSANNWQAIRTALVFQGHKARGGVWMESKRLLEVDVPGWGMPRSVMEFKEGIHTIGRIARHEFQHVGQTLFKVLMKKGDLLGMPGQKLRDPSRDELGFPKTPGGTLFNQRLRAPHALQDVEFYTRLADEVVNFTAFARSIPIPSRREAVAHYTAAKSGMFRYENQENGRTVQRTIAAAPFFEMLKRNQPDKWRKAVAEFVKEIGKKGVRMASKTHEGG